MKTRLHINLHNQRVAITQCGVVVGYCASATMLDCGTHELAKKAAFSRTPGNKRTVHLWVTGALVDVVGFEPLKGRQVLVTPLGIDHDTISRRASYNPKRGDQGFMVDGEVWTGGKACTVSVDGMRVF
jgi:hypothetical protein